MMHKSIYTLIFTIVSMTIMSAQEQIIDKVIVNVGGEYILYSEMVQNYRYVKEQNPDANVDLCSVTEQIIAQKILVDQAKLDSIIVPEGELENQLDYRFQNILRAMSGDENRFREYYGKSVAQMKDEQREEMRQQILAERIQGRLISEVTITPKEVVEFFDKIPTDSIPYLSSEVEISEIVYKPKVSAAEHKKAVDQLTEIRDKIVSGESSFEELAVKHSADGSAESGGDLGWAQRGSYVPEFEAAAYTLEQDEVSDIVETEFGFHIIKLNERRGNSIRLQHILIRPTINQEDLDLSVSFLDSLRNRIVVDSLPFDYAVKLYSDKSAQSYHNGGRMANPKTGSNIFETADLPPDIYFEIEDIEVGEVTKPLEYFDRGGETLYRIVMLNSRTKPHRASLEQDYSRISTFAKESKKNIYYNNWMVGKMEETFIKVDDDLSTCENLMKWVDN